VAPETLNGTGTPATKESPSKASDRVGEDDKKVGKWTSPKAGELGSIELPYPSCARTLRVGFCGHSAIAPLADLNSRIKRWGLPLSGKSSVTKVPQSCGNCYVRPYASLGAATAPAPPSETAGARPRRAGARFFLGGRVARSGWRHGMRRISPDLQRTPYSPFAGAQHEWWGDVGQPSRMEFKGLGSGMKIACLRWCCA
jgi:hypothetical protein